VLTHHIIDSNSLAPLIHFQWHIALTKQIHIVLYCERNYFTINKEPVFTTKGVDYYKKYMICLAIIKRQSRPLTASIFGNPPCFSLLKISCPLTVTSNDTTYPIQNTAKFWLCRYIWKPTPKYHNLLQYPIYCSVSHY